MRKSFTISIEENLIKKIKKRAIENNTDVSSMIEEWIRNEIK